MGTIRQLPKTQSLLEVHCQCLKCPQPIFRDDRITPESLHLEKQKAPVSLNDMLCGTFCHGMQFEALALLTSKALLTLLQLQSCTEASGHVHEMMAPSSPFTLGPSPSLPLLPFLCLLFKIVSPSGQGPVFSYIAKCHVHR